MIEVSAQSLYEAVAQALRIFREDDWIEDSRHGPASVTVAVKQPEIEHKVRIEIFELARFIRQESRRNGFEKAGCVPILQALILDIRSPVLVNSLLGLAGEFVHRRVARPVPGRRESLAHLAPRSSRRMLTRQSGSSTACTRGSVGEARPLAIQPDSGLGSRTTTQRKTF